MSAEASRPSIQGVPLDHPRVTANIRSMKNNGYRKEEIAKLVGIPVSAVESVLNEQKGSSERSESQQ